jgi:hypothetical protein
MSRARLIMHGRVGTDTTPDAFTFTDVTSAPLSTTETSNTITIAGLGSGVSVAVTVTGGTYSKNGGSYVSSAGTAQNGDTFAVRHTSSSGNSTATDTTLTVGGVSDTFTSTTVASSAAIIYDTTLGNGVDTNGFADLPLNSGASYFFVGSGGNDANNGTTHALRKATIASAAALMVDSRGDQVLIAEGSSFSEGFPNLQAKRGASSVYCSGFRSYDPADPTNTAKYGRAIHPNRPVINTGANNQDLVGGGGLHPDQPPNNIAFQGLDLNPGPQAGISFIPGNGVYIGQVLFENCIFRQVGIAIQNNGQYGYAGIGGWIIFRNCSLYGQWTASGDGSGVYIDGAKHVTLEDCVWVRNGWSMTANRDDAKAAGGCTGIGGRRHAWYLQEDCNTTVSRRNLIIDPSCDGGQNRSSTLLYDNVIIDSPVVAALGSGAAYWVTKPRGVDIDYSYNFAIGDADITSSDLRRWFIASANGTAISRCYANTATASNSISGANNSTFSVDVLSGASSAGVPSYMTFSYNYAPNRTQVLSQVAIGGTGISHISTDHNVWDKASAGTDLNGSAFTPTNAYTASQLYLGNGYADKTALVTYAINHPEAHPGRGFLTMGRTGYNYAPTPTTLQTLTTTMNLVRGLDDGSVFIGTIEGSTLTAQTALPTGVTLESSTRTWHYDGTGSGTTSGTVTIRETASDGTTTHDSVISWTATQPAALTLGSVSGVGTTTATLNVTTNTGSGEFRYVVDLETHDGWWHGRRYDIAGLISTNGVYTGPTGASGTQAVPSTGAKTISITGLTTATQYHAYVVQVTSSSGGEVVSAVIDLGSFPTS